MIEDLSKQLVNGSPEEKLQALRQIVKIGGKEAGKALVLAMKQEQDPGLQAKMKKGIEVIKMRMAEKLGTSTLRSKTGEASVLDWVRSNDPEQERLALQHIFKTRDRESLKSCVEQAVAHGSVSFCKGTLKLIERLLPENSEELIFPFMSRSEEEVAVKAIEILMFSRSVHQLVKREDYLRAVPLTMLKQAIEWFDTAHGNVLPPDLRVLIKSLIREREAKPVDSGPRIVIDPELLPKTRDQAMASDSQVNEARQKKMTQINRARNELEQAQDSQKIISLFARLIELEDQGCVESILQKISVSKDENVMAAGLDAIAKTGREAGLAALNSYAEHASPKIKAVVARGYRYLLPDKPRPVLERFLKDKDPAVIAEALIGLYPEKETLCFVPLSTLVNSTDESKALMGLYAISEIGSDNLLLMAHKAMKTREGKVKEAASKVFENWKGNEELKQAGPKMSVEDFANLLRQVLDKQAAKQRKEAEAMTNSEPGADDKAKNGQAKSTGKSLLGSLFNKLVKK